MCVCVFLNVPPYTFANYWIFNYINITIIVIIIFIILLLIWFIFLSHYNIYLIAMFIWLFNYSVIYLFIGPHTGS